MYFCRLPEGSPMSIKRIKAVLLQEYYVTYRSVEVIFDVFVFAIISLLLFGFIASYLTGEAGGRAAHYILLGMLLWEILRIIQYSISVGSMWNIWSRNLSNMFVAPLSVTEYLSAHTMSGIVKAVLVFVVNSLITYWIFDFNVFVLGPMLIVYIAGLGMFAFSAGIAILGIIFRFGTRIQAFAWGLLPILQPLTAAFFPVRVLPGPLQTFAWSFPSTHIFEAARFHLDTGIVDWYALSMGLALNIIYIVGAILFFSHMFRGSMNSGQFSRNES